MNAFHQECQRRKIARNNLPCLVEIIPTYVIQGKVVFQAYTSSTNLSIVLLQDRNLVQYS